MNSYIKGRIGWQNLRSDEFIEEGPYLVTGMHFLAGTVDWTACYRISEARYEMAPEIQLRVGDVLITKDGTVGKLAYIDHLPGAGAATLNSHLLVVRPLQERYLPRFLFHVLSSSHFTRYSELNQNGTTFLGITQDAIERFPIWLPPPSEQATIAAFLDRETGKIDALVEEQRRLIELLKEKRQAVISHAVTKGLDPNAKMKPSGVEWLGDVPEHWEVRRLKSLTPQITVGIVVEPSKYYADYGVPALRSLNVEAGRINSDGLVYISSEANEALLKSQIRSGDLVAVRSGQPGTTAVVPEEFDGANCIDLIIIRKPTVGSEWFLCWYLASDFALRQFAEGSGGAIQQHFNIGMAMNLVVAVPPADEQGKVAEFLAETTKKLDRLIAEADRAVELLQERRAALISAAVTGKIDVREFAEAETVAA